MSERECVLSILKDYQREFVESEKKITIGNFSRRAGKSFTQVAKILYDRPRYCYYVGSYSGWSNFQKLFDEIRRLLGESLCITTFNSCSNHIIIRYKCDDVVTIYNYAKLESDSMRGVKKPDVVDMTIFDDCLPICTIPSRKYISMVSMSQLNSVLYRNKDIKIIECGLKRLSEDKIFNLKQLSNFKDINAKSFDREMDILNEFDSIFEKEKPEKSLTEILDEQLEETIKELADIPKTSNTTITRMNLVNIIKGLQNLKNNG